MKSSQKFHNYDRKGFGCQYKNPFLSRINKQKMFLDKAFFTLNFKWKALKIVLKNVTVPALYHARFRVCTSKRLAIKDLFGELRQTGVSARRRVPDYRRQALQKGGIPPLWQRGVRGDFYKNMSFQLRTP